jgi:hypothetical protein
MKIRDFSIFRLKWHLEGFGSMENTPTGCGSDLHTILRILKNDRKSRSVNNLFQPLDLDPNRIKDFFYQPKLRPVDWAQVRRATPRERLGWLGRHRVGFKKFIAQEGC